MNLIKAAIAAILLTSHNLSLADIGEDFVGSMNRHKHTVVEPRQMYSRAVTQYLSGKAFQRRLEQQQRDRSSKPIAPDEGSSDTVWVGFSWTPEEPPEMPEANRMREELCSDLAPGATVDELVTRAELFLAYIDTLTREDEEHWHRLYLEMTPDEQASVDRILSELEPTREATRYRFDKVAAEAPQGFEMYLRRRCDRWAATSN